MQFIGDYAEVNNLMMAWTHAAIGAAIGSRTPTRQRTQGVVSHGLADLVPHRDFDMKIEVPLLGLILAFIAWRYGLKSKQLWGASGGFSPDIENGLRSLGWYLNQSILLTPRENGSTRKQASAARLASRARKVESKFSSYARSRHSTLDTPQTRFRGTSIPARPRAWQASRHMTTT